MLERVKDHTEYDCSGQILNVRMKYGFDTITMPNTVKNFLMSHDSFVHPRHVLRNEVSLYNITKTEAVFVEAPPGVEAWRHQYGSFHKQAQFDYAIKVIRMPLYAFHRLASEVGDPAANLIFMNFIPRSGSTLMCRVFEATGKCVSFAEPHTLSQMLAKVVQPEEEIEFSRTVQSGVRLLCKPRQNADVLAFMIKMLPQGDLINFHLKKHFPEARFMFLYRNPRECVISVQRVSNTLNCSRVVLRIEKFNRTLYVKAMRVAIFDKGLICAGLPIIQILQATPSPLAIVGYYFWATYVKLNIMFNETNSSKPLSAHIYMPGIKYEDIVANPHESIRVILEHCGLPLDLLPLALSGINTDSQANSVIGRAQLATHEKTANLIGSVAEDITVLSKYYGTPDLSEDYRFPETITKAVYGI